MFAFSKVNMAVDGEICKIGQGMKNRAGIDAPSRLRLPNSLQCLTMMPRLFRAVQARIYALLVSLKEKLKYSSVLLTIPFSVQEHAG
jgi:hypothetical protein